MYVHVWVTFNMHVHVWVTFNMHVYVWVTHVNGRYMLHVCFRMTHTLKRDRDTKQNDAKFGGQLPACSPRRGSRLCTGGEGGSND